MRPVFFFSGASPEIILLLRPWIYVLIKIFLRENKAAN